MQQTTMENPAPRKVVIFLAAVVLVFLFRSLWTYPVDHVDGLFKFVFSTEILGTGDWNLMLHSHHTLRWAAMLPQIGLTWLMGARYETFFIMPLLMFSLYVVLIIFSLRNILNISQLLLLGTILMADTMGFYVSNHYSVTGMGIFFSFAGILVLINRGLRPNLAVVISATLFFVAYGAHVTYLSFAAGGLLWLVFCQRKPSSAMLFCMTIMVLMMVEILVFNYLSDWQLTLGRLEMLAYGHHVERSLSRPSATFGQLFTRWLYLPKPDVLLCLLFLSAGPWLILQKRKGNNIPPLIACTYLVGLCFAIAVTFAVLSVNPIIPAMPLRIRYLIPFLPFAAIISMYMLSTVLPKLMGRNYFRAERVGSLVFAVFMLTWPSLRLDFFKNNFDAFMWKAEREYVAFSEKFLRGELILTGKKKLAYVMIVQFRYPVKFIDRERGVSVANISTSALCVDRLDEVPLDLNYKECTD